MWQLRPSQQFASWLQRHFEKRQREEQRGLRRREHFLDIPEITVSPHLTINPLPPLRHDVPLLEVAVTNGGGEANLVQGSFRVSLAEYPDYRQEKYLIGINLPRAKKQELAFELKRTIIADVMIRHATLKLDYELSFRGLNGKVEERKHSYRYDPDQQDFVAD